MRNIFYRLSLALSKTDAALLARCNSRSRMHQQSLGMFVLVTGAFALFSSFYALTTAFGTWDEFNGSYYLPLNGKIMVGLCSLLYAGMITLIDREIVSSRNKSAALLRIPLAIIIGIIISVPVKLNVLEGRINQQIRDEQIAKMTPYKNDRDNFIRSADTSIVRLEKELSTYIRKKNAEQRRMEAEDMGMNGLGLTGQAGQGKFYEYAKINVENYSKIIEDLRNDISEKKKYRSDRANQIEQDQNKYVSEESHDLWGRYLAMHRIVEEDETGQSKMMVLGLSLLFILLELIPAIIKLMSPEEEYDLVLNYVMKSVKKKLEKAENNEDSDDDDFIKIPEIQAA